MILVRWLAGRLYGRADLPRRWAWLLVFAGCQTLASWIAGRLWTP
jgi:hypothetical protein